LQYSLASPERSRDPSLTIGLALLPTLKIVVNLQCQVYVVEEVTPPVMHDQRA
jgi:hypothetical protein